MHLTLDGRVRGNAKKLKIPFVESFNGHFRQECLDQHWFATLAEAREVMEAWRVEYNEERPHRALQQRTPAAFLAGWEPLATAAD